MDDNLPVFSQFLAQNMTDLRDLTPNALEDRAALDQFQRSASAIGSHITREILGDPARFARRVSGHFGFSTPKELAGAAQRWEVSIEIRPAGERAQQLERISELRRCLNEQRVRAEAAETEVARLLWTVVGAA